MIVAGRQGARQIAASSTRSRNGREIVIVYAGPIKDIFAMDRSIYLSGASSVDVVQQEGSCIAKLTARYTFTPGEDPDQEIFEETTVDVTETPVPLKQSEYFSTLSSDAIKTLDDAIESRAAFPSGGAGLTGDIKEDEYYRFRLHLGVNDFEANLPIVRYTIRCSPRYTGFLDTLNNGAIFTKAQVLDRIAAPKLFTLQEPTAVFLDNSYGCFYSGWRLKAIMSFDGDGNGVLEESYRWGQFLKQTHVFNFPTP